MFACTQAHAGPHKQQESHLYIFISLLLLGSIFIAVFGTQITHKEEKWFVYKQK